MLHHTLKVFFFLAARVRWDGCGSSIVQNIVGRLIGANGDVCTRGACLGLSRIFCAVYNIASSTAYMPAFHPADSMVYRAKCEQKSANYGIVL